MKFRSGPFLVAVVMLCGLAVAAYARVDMKDVVGLWLFDNENDEAVDLTDNENHGTLEGKPQWVDGKFEGALELNGEDDYIQIVPSESLDAIDDQITLSAWVYPDGVQNTTKDGTSAISGGIIEKNEATGFLLKSWEGIGAGTITWHFSVAGNWSIAVTPGILNEWQHIACTYDNESAKIYLNGVLKADNAKTGPINTAADQLTLGIRLTGDHTAWFKGMIDEIAILDVALEESDIEAIAERGIGSVLGIRPVEACGKAAASWGALKRQY